MNHRFQHELHILSGDLQGQVHVVDGELIVGRSTSCDVFIPDRRMSRRHARFYSEGRSLFVEDLESHNGTYVNGKRVARMQLFTSDVVRVGTSQFEVTAREAIEDSAPVQLVGDPGGLHPQLVKQVSPHTHPSLTQMLAEEYFDAIGAGGSSEADTTSPEQVRFLVQQTRNFALLHEISKVIQTMADPREMCQVVLGLILKVTRADRGFVVRVDAESGDDTLVPLAVLDRKATDNPDGPMRSTLKMSETVAEQVIKERCGVITSDAMSDTRFSGAESLVLNDIHSLLAVPMVVGDRVTGLIEIENNQLINSFTENDLDLLSVVASMVGVAVENLELAQQRERTIAELQEAQEQLLKAQDQLVRSESLAAIGRFASGIAHEVKNHLAPFMLADMLARQYPEDEDVQESAELMLEAQRRILGLIDEIRHFASGASASYEIMPHDLCRVIDGVIRFVKCDARVKAMSVVFEPTERPLVDMDAGRMRQVFINLIRNAADAIDHTDGSIEIRLHEQGDQVIIEVSDNGLGINQDVAHRLFEPFFTTKGDKGLGLGLDISRKIVRAHQGALTFETNAAGGTTFRIIMPTVQEADDLEFSFGISAS
ncbi:MAG: FHA domain-containing protein [Myxococcales bacterium]|nr:FHA domain-containing protein [Myxococcales bacterium]